MSALLEPSAEGIGTVEPDTATVDPAPAPATRPGEPLWTRVLAAHPKTWLMTFDAVAAALGLYLGPGLVGQKGPTPTASWAVLAGVFFLVAGTFSKLYQARFTALRGDEFRRVLVTASWMAAAVVIGAWALAVPVERSWLLAAFVSVIVAVTLERELSRSLLDAVRRRGLLLRRAVVIGGHDDADEGG
ncbi:MAG: hypothetical protein AAGK32_06775, partial [Actinomycetota bacterium]